MLRAIEWGQWPLFLAQPVAPIALIFIPWLHVVVGLLIATWLWAPLRCKFVSLYWAEFGVHFVDMKWAASIIAAIYLAYHQRYPTAVLAGLWPIVTLGLQSLVPTAPIGILQEKFAARLLELATSQEPS